MPELSQPKLRGSFTEHNLDAEPYRPDEACHDNCDRGLERKTLSLFDALAPTPQVLKVGSQLLSVLLLYPKRSQDCRDGFENHGVDVVVTKPLLFGERLGDNGPDILAAHFVHRLMIPAVIA
jgi:hypothetical protein